MFSRRILLHGVSISFKIVAFCGGTVQFSGSTQTFRENLSSSTSGYKSLIHTE